MCNNDIDSLINIKLNIFENIYYTILRYIDNIKSIPRRVKWVYQRARRGFSDSDIWSGDYHIAYIIYNICDNIKEHGCTYPASITSEEWDDILTKISKGFKLYTEKDFFFRHEDIIENKDTIEKFVQEYPEDSPTMEDYDIMKESMRLFTIYFPDLWD